MMSISYQIRSCNPSYVSIMQLHTDSLKCVYFFNVLPFTFSKIEGICVSITNHPYSVVKEIM